MDEKILEKELGKKIQMINFPDISLCYLEIKDETKETIKEIKKKLFNYGVKSIITTNERIYFFI